MGVNWTDGKLKLVRQTVEQNNWLEPFRWNAVCPFWRTLEQPEQQILTVGGGAWTWGGWGCRWVCGIIGGCILAWGWIWGCIWVLGCSRSWSWVWDWGGRSIVVPLSEAVFWDITENEDGWECATEAAWKQTHKKNHKWAKRCWPF